MIPLVRRALKGCPEGVRDERRTYLGQKRRQTGGVLGLLAARLGTGRRVMSCLELIDDLDGRFRSEVLLSIATLGVRGGGPRRYRLIREVVRTKKSSLMAIMGALLHAPRHSTSTSVNFPSAVVWPGATPSLSSSVLRIEVDPHPPSMQGVVVHSWTKCLPTGERLNIV